ncbi:SPL family radical SAM protein [Gordonibacter massiliensis (ex Traore et al. 2017)]|uniref:SPL family radical SAM protein n=1 Tax=Gordonibacter massiliensis (ex Traore et al. 2017) TaxID=1841863 RepID=UPI001C8B4BF8|nr:radical SAM protein [Gordonibacter massiliensis (ex Traore et al. 2017)]
MSGSAPAPCPTVRARSILQKVRRHGDEWFGIDYNMNLYRGCCHGCIYCDSRSECYRVDDFDRVRVKFDALAILRRELRSRRVRGVVGVGAMSDTYNPFERNLNVTRGALELLAEHGFGVSVDTKSTLVTRDIDLLRAIGGAGGAIAKLTITTADDRLARLIEPHAPAPSERFTALAELAEAGVFCGVLFTPTLPWVTDDETTVRGVVEGAAAAGARFVYHMTGVTMRDRQRDHFLERIAAVDPALPDRYRRAFSDRYFCNSPRAAENRALFRALCKEHGLLWRMPDIIAAYKPAQPVGSQGSLF